MSTFPFKGQVYFLKVVQIRTPSLKMHKFCFTDFLKIGNFPKVTKEKDSYNVITTAGPEMWKRKIAIIYSNSVIYLSV